MRLSIFLLLTFALSFSGFAEIGANSTKNVKLIVEKTVENLKQLESVDDFEVLLAKKKKKKKKKRKKRRRKRRKRKKPSRMSLKNSKTGRFYLEFNIGQISHGTQTEDALEEEIQQGSGNSGITISNFDAEDSSIGFSFGGGYYFTDWFAFEGFYSVLGSETTSFAAGGTGTIAGNSVEIERSFNVIELNAKFAYWMGANKQFGLYAKPGLMYWSMSVDTKYDVLTSENVSLSGSGTSFLFGLGAEYFMSKRFYTGVGLMLYPSLGDDELGSQGHTKYLLNLGMLF